MQLRNSLWFNLEPENFFSSSKAQTLLTEKAVTFNSSAKELKQYHKFPFSVLNTELKAVEAAGFLSPRDSSALEGRLCLS